MTHAKCVAETRTLTFEDVIGETIRQTVVRAVIDVTEHQKPPVTQIIDVLATARIIGQRIVDGKVIFEGEVHVKVVYEAALPDQPVWTAEADIRFSDFVDIEGALPGDRLFVSVTVEDVTARLISPTRIQITVVLATFVKVVREQEKTVVVDVKGPRALITRTEVLALRRVVVEGVRQVLLRVIDDLRELGKPPFVQLIDVLSTARVTDVRLIENKVLVEGVVEVKILYAAPNQQVVVVAQEVPFSDFVDLPGARPGMEVEVSVVVELVTVEPEDMGRRLIKTIVLQLTARVFEIIRVRVVVDVRGIPGIKVGRQLVRVEDVIGVGEAQIIVRERLDPRVHDKPCPVQIIDCLAFPRITEVRVITDKVVILGRVEIKVIYESKDQTIHVLRDEFPFQGFADIPGARPGQAQVSTVSVLDVTCVLAPAPVLKPRPRTEDLIPEDETLDPDSDRKKCPFVVDVTAVLLVRTRLVAGRQVEVVTSVFCPAKPDGVFKCVVTADSVNVRSGPGTGFPVIAQVSRGTKVVLLAEVGQWSRVFIPDLNIEGFIFSRFIFCEKPLG